MILKKLTSDATKISKRAALVSAGLLGAALFLVVLTLLHIAQQQNAVSLSREKSLIASLVERQQFSIERTLNDYAAWGEAYQNLSASANVDWAYTRGNLGRSLYEEFYVQELYVIAPQNNIAYAVVNGDLATAEPDASAPPDLMPVIEAARAAAENETTPVSRFLELRGKPALVAAGTFSTADDMAVEPVPGPASVLVFVDELDEERLAELGAQVFVENLGIGRVPLSPAHLFVPSAGQQQLALTWDPAKPGTALLQTVLPWLAVGGAALLFLAWVTQRGLVRAADEIDRSREELETSEARFRDVAEAASDWIWEADENLVVRYLSERFESITGRPKSDLLGKGLDAFLQPNEGDLRWLWRRSRSLPLPKVLCRYLGVGRQPRLCRLSGMAIWDKDNRLTGFRGVVSDVTDEVEAQNRILHLSMHDMITGLPNRLSLLERMDALILEYRPFATIFIDVDRFKAVNDSMGHRAGDVALAELARRLVEVTEEEGFAARIGGDEFMVIAPGKEGLEDAYPLCQRIIAAFSEPLSIDGRNPQVGGTIGVAFFPRDATSPDMLMRAADVALYDAKRTRRGDCKSYSEDLSRAVLARQELEGELRSAVSLDQLVLHYQPRFNVQTGEMTAVEALIRWQHPSRGMVPPGAFIPIAEESGLIDSIGEWALQTACREIAPLEGIRVSVNVSPAQVTADGGLRRAVKAALAASALPPGRLELEFTESAFIQDVEDVSAVLKELKSFGVNLAIDDFGKGFSSLSHIQRFPFDRIKLDKMFIGEMQQSQRAISIVKAVLALADALGMAVTAEGVETSEQLDDLRKLGCEEVQGFLLAKPLPLSNLLALVSARRLLAPTR
jgi:diguanylate cyclase (GGDEF)-like protein/PAS domain S-box-containing protein